MDERELEHAAEVFGRFLESGEDAPALLQPTDEALDDVALAVCFSVEFHGPRVAAFVLLRWDHRIDAEVQEVLVNPVGAIPFVSTQRQRPSDALTVAVEQMAIRTVENLLQGSAFMGLARRQMKMQGMAGAIAEDMDFRGKTAAGAA